MPRWPAEGEQNVEDGGRQRSCPHAAIIHTGNIFSRCIVGRQCEVAPPRRQMLGASSDDGKCSTRRADLRSCCAYADLFVHMLHNSLVCVTTARSIACAAEGAAWVCARAQARPASPIPWRWPASWPWRAGLAQPALPAGALPPVVSSRWMLVTLLNMPSPSCFFAPSSNQGIAFVSFASARALISPTTLLPSFASQVGPP